MKNDKLISLFDGLGQRYGQRPSDLLGITDARVALDFDIAVAVRGSVLEKEAMDENIDKPPKKKIIGEPVPMDRDDIEQQFANMKRLQNKAK